MGDVSDAMDRARRDRQSDAQAPQRDSGAVNYDSDLPPSDASQAETGGLPIEDVDGQSMTQDADAIKAPSPAAANDGSIAGTDPTASSDAVGRAMDKGTEARHAQAVAAAQSAADATTSHASSVNGYAPDLVVHHDRGSLITEQYRAVRTQILARARSRKIQTHVVTSSAPGEGKSVTTMNLGVAMSEMRNEHTVLIEGDLRRPSFHKLLSREALTPGLSQYLRGEAEVDDVLHPTVYDNLHLIPAGSAELTSSTELLSSPRLAVLLDRLRDRFDHIFVDSPPVVSVTDACILGAMCDETLLVVRLHKTPTSVVDRAKRLLRAANCEVAGVVLTHLETRLPRYLYRYDRYAYK